MQYNNAFVFNELNMINNIRNRIAHHEPICFASAGNIDTQGVLDCYAKMMRLFQWMNIDANALLYGLDHVGVVSSSIMKI